MKGWGFWVVAALVVMTLVGFHVSNHNESYFEPVADVYLTLDDNASAIHSFDRARGYRVRGGTLTARVIEVYDLGMTDHVHRAFVDLEIGFDIDNRYDGWGWSRLDRPILYGWVQGARGVGEGETRHVEHADDLTFLSPIHPPAGRTRYAPSLDGSCSTDYRHDWCRYFVRLPITGDDTYVNIHLRERFR